MTYLSAFKTFFVTTRRISLGLAFLKFIRALLSIYAVILSAKYFGASIERDKWVIAGSAVVIMTQLMFGPVNEIFRAKFIHMRAEDGEEMALESARSLISSIILVALLIITLVEVFPNVVSSLLAPGFKGAERDSLALMIRWIVPSLLLSEITLIWIALLNVYHSYFIPDFYSLISGVINVASILLLAPLLGIYSLIIANYVETVILSVILVFALLKVQKSILAWSRPKWDSIKPFVFTSFPFYLAFLAGNVQMTVERMLSTYLGVGNVSVLDYSRKFIDLPTGVLVGVMAAVLTPTLSELFIHGKRDDFNRETIISMRMIMLVFTPFIVLFSVCSKEMVELLLVRGAFRRDLIDVTAQSLMFFCFGLVGYIFYAVGAQSLIAQKKGAFYAIVGTVATMVSIAMNLSFFKVAGLVIFPFSWGITLFLAGIYMVSYQNHKRLETLREIGKMLSLLILVMLFSFAARELSVRILYETVTDLKMHDLFVVLTTAVIGNLLYFGTVILFKLEETCGIRRYITGKI